VTPAEEQLYPTGNEYYQDDDEQTGSCRYESDFAYVKPRADLLLVGKCHPQGGKAVPTCQVTFRVGSKSKTVAVFGDRYWKRSLGLVRTISDPQPFEEMNLRYENSFGGEGFQMNPEGKGYCKQETNAGERVWPLPNIEAPNSLIDSPRSRPEPAGFGPLGRMWKERHSKLGTYKGKWLKTRWPWFPENFDWTHFNATPSDMHVEDYLKGDEQLYFENLHMEHPRYEAQLPGLRVRCFLNNLTELDTNRTHFREVRMNLDTLWVDMEAEKLVLLWRGWAEVQSEEFEEVQHVFIVSEAVHKQAKSVGHYHDLLNKQLSNLEQEWEIEKKEPGVAEEEKAVESSDDLDVEQEIAKAEKARRAQLIAAGLDPDNLPPLREEDKQKEDQILRELGIDLTEPETQPITRELIQERIVRKESFAGEDLTGIDLSDLQMIELDLQEVILAGVALRNTDLTGADLTGANLAGADLSAANLRKACLKETDLTGARLVEANLTGALIEDAIFEKAVLKGAFLNQVTAKHTNFSEAEMTGASLKEGDFPGADFSRSNLNDADFRGSNLREASVEGAVGIQINMAETDLSELRASEGCDFSQGSFRKAVGKESIWEKANLTESDFSFSQMEGADFTAATLKFANLSAANMKFARFSKANLREAKLIQINLFQGSLEKADLTRTDLRGSNLYGVEFLGSVIEDTNFEFANVKMTKLA
jgi:uncharacterized protein YjbI with pentapeptide repeats